ncbi:hypothetical protein [Roseicyclus sp.]|uniref:hypothetical protein n=1 Tax=Roseicyclus sp. TaxID=1914329 RepID=UPI003FA0764F
MAVSRGKAACAAILSAALASGAAAQEAVQQAVPALGIELNRVLQVEGACRLTFLAENGLGADLGQVVFETVLFTTDGAVERLTLLDLGALPAGRPRVREFDMGGLSCDALGRVLINGVDTCAGAEASACAEGLSVESRVDGVEVIG